MLSYGDADASIAGACHVFPDICIWASRIIMRTVAAGKELGAMRMPKFIRVVFRKAVVGKCACSPYRSGAYSAAALGRGAIVRNT